MLQEIYKNAWLLRYCRVIVLINITDKHKHKHICIEYFITYCDTYNNYECTIK